MSHLDKSLTTVDELKTQLLNAQASFARQLADKDAEIAALKKLDGPAEQRLKEELLNRYNGLEAVYDNLKKVQLGCVDAVKAWVKKEIKEYVYMAPCTVTTRGRSDVEILIEHNLERVSAATLVHAQKQCDDAIRRDRENHELRKRAADFDRTLANRAEDDKKNKIDRDEAVLAKLDLERTIRDLTRKLHTLGEMKDAATKEVAELRDKVDENKELVHTAKVNKAAYTRLQNEVKKASNSIEAARNQLAHTIDAGFDVPGAVIDCKMSDPAIRRERLSDIAPFFLRWSYDDHAVRDHSGDELSVSYRFKWGGPTGPLGATFDIFNVTITAGDFPGFEIRVEHQDYEDRSDTKFVDVPATHLSTESAAAELFNVASDLIRGIANK